MQKYIFLENRANKNDKTLSKNDIFNVCKHKQRSIVFKKKENGKKHLCSGVQHVSGTHVFKMAGISPKDMC